MAAPRQGKCPGRITSALTVKSGNNKIYIKIFSLLLLMQLMTCLCPAISNELAPSLGKIDCIIHSFIQAISIAPFQVHYCSEALPTQHGLLCRSFTPKHHRKLRVKDQGLCIAAKAGFEPTTLRMKGDESTNGPLHPTYLAKMHGSPVV